MSKRYSPLAALKALKRVAPRLTGAKPDIKTAGGPVLPEYVPKGRPETVCFLLTGFIDGSAVVPDDFDNVRLTVLNPETARADRVKAFTKYVRPDGGVWIGSTELKDTPGSRVFIYGDPMMSEEEMKAATRRFWAELAANRAIYDEHKALGPFAGKQPPKDE